MARGLFSDHLLSHRFHLLDVDFSLNIPPFVLLPSAGFSSITAPELTIDTEEVTEGTSDFRHHVLKKGSVGSITLTRGATMYNSDFWRWIISCLKGVKSNDNIIDFLGELAISALSFGGNMTSGKRRNLVLMQLSGVSPEGLALATEQGDTVDKLRAIAAFPGAGVSGLVEGISQATGGFVDFGISSIPAT